MEQMISKIRSGGRQALSPLVRENLAIAFAGVVIGAIILAFSPFGRALCGQ